ncbi:MAG: TrmH family RNA methyltransferase [Burkholderiales bacterium]
MSLLRSRDNPRVRRWRALTHEARARRAERRALIEGPHLLAAYLDTGARPQVIVVSESGTADTEVSALARRCGCEPVRLTDALFRWIVDVASPVGVAAEIALPETEESVGTARHAVFLDAIQDSGNVGAILRSAAAFGVDTAVLGPGCADPWSPKVLRAGMGGHFGLRVAETEDLASALAEFNGPVVCTVPKGGNAPSAIDLTGRLGWILGAEGRGVGASLAALALHRVSIPMMPGIESLNVAAAAAILLYERARQLSKRGARS